MRPREWNGIAGLLLTMFAIVMASGCSTPYYLRVEDMVPPIPPAASPATDKILQITKVYGGEEPSSFTMWQHESVKIDNKSFQEALFKSLQNSKLFKDVVLSDNGDYELVAEIASQNINRISFITFSAQLLVNYHLIDKRTRQEVFTEHIFSQATVAGDYFSEGFIVASKKAYEAAVRENLAQFLNKVSSFVGKRSSEKMLNRSLHISTHSFS